MRAGLGLALRWAADRIDRANAPRLSGYRFWFEDHVGIVISDTGPRGCPLMYDPRQYHRAWPATADMSPRRSRTCR